ncbi:hypothetical protein [Oleidesulfovibrio sp.]|uniref:hypothetical protein n=1 Tax=Oleidesulfovibrio sp. TaxID=2909707 RepID=UPI003A856E40
MRYVHMLVLAFGVVLTLCSALFAMEMDGTAYKPKGRALVTGIEARDSAWDFISNIFITNVSDTEVTCRITVYNHIGENVSSLCNVYTGSTSGSPVELTSGGNEFRLPPANTRMVQVWAPGMMPVVFGHAVIEWTSESTTVRKALVAALKTVRVNGASTYGFMSQINGGEPF